ncbi:cytochrome P450 [Kineosporia succinea]|uniref:Cytochrome P450 n=1 Tax=Kineosporia succinea TaxID=84632 RepID=A0ABT9P831_9ACTN|nr:hypothetical protein [Kineosporia succinea]MDP9828833.1 cytochrome P450 [Kineosporia succinea]
MTLPAVERTALPGGLPVFTVTGSAPARRALNHPRLASDPRRLPDPAHGFGGCRHQDDMFAAEGRHLLNSDGADHRRLRDVLAPRLSQEQATSLRDPLEKACHELLDAVGETADLVAGYARPLAVRATADALGIPPADREALTAATLARINGGHPDDPEVRAAQTRLEHRWIRLLARKRRDRDPHGLLNHLLTAHGQGRLSAEELVSVALGLFSGGISPVTVFVVSGAVELLRDPELRERLGDDRTVDDLFRRTVPFPVASWRFALDDVEVDGTVIPSGSVVLVRLRTDDATNLAFGAGPHYCPGAHLARLVGSLALRTLFGRFPHLRLAVDERELTWHGDLVERCYDSVPVQLTPTT